MKRKVEVELTNPRTLGSVQKALADLRVAGAPEDASIRISGGYPGAEEFYVAEATWDAAPVPTTTEEQP